MAKKRDNEALALPAQDAEIVAQSDLVPMKRNAEQWPPEKYGPSTAMVHVEEVDNWKNHGWEHAD